MKRLMAGMAVGVMAIGMAGAANATIAIYNGIEDGNLGTENVLFDEGTGFNVTGHLNQSEEIIVNFTGQELLKTVALGQARIESDDENGFNWIQIMLADPTLGFSKIIFNIDAAADGQVNLDFVDQFGAHWEGAYNVNGNGQNFFTAIGLDNQVAVSATIEGIGELSTNGLINLQQVRIGPTDRTLDPVPEPATMLLMGTGLAGLIGARRKNKA